jgi:hypothetical protein
MKKFLALALIVMMMLTLTGCFGIGSTASTEPTVDPEQAPALSTYTKDFAGLQQYLIDRALLPYADLSAATPDSSDASAKRTAVYYDIIGADNGVRYNLGGTVFIELYDFSNAKNDTAKSVLADIKDDGAFYPIENYDKLTGVISASGKYVAVYNTKNQYDYAKITDELANW